MSKNRAILLILWLNFAWIFPDWSLSCFSEALGLWHILQILNRSVMKIIQIAQLLRVRTTRTLPILRHRRVIRRLYRRRRHLHTLLSLTTTTAMRCILPHTPLASLPLLALLTPTTISLRKPLRLAPEPATLPLDLLLPPGLALLLLVHCVQQAVSLVYLDWGVLVDQGRAGMVRALGSPRVWSWGVGWVEEGHVVFDGDEVEVLVVTAQVWY